MTPAAKAVSGSMAAPLGLARERLSNRTPAPTPMTVGAHHDAHSQDTAEHVKYTQQTPSSVAHYLGNQYPSAASN